MRRFLFALTLLYINFNINLTWADTVHTIRFDKGDDSATVSGKITGGEIVDYKLAAKAGQTMTVIALGTSNVFFNILPPDGIAIYNSSNTYEDVASVTLPVSNTYTIRLYLKGEDKDADHTINYMVKVRVAGE